MAKPSIPRSFQPEAHPNPIESTRCRSGFLLAYGLRFERPWESRTDVAYRICGACGFDSSEVDQLIGTARHSTLSHEENLELYRSTFDRRANVELCIDCAEAVLDAIIPH